MKYELSYALETLRDLRRDFEHNRGAKTSEEFSEVYRPLAEILDQELPWMRNYDSTSPSHVCNVYFYYTGAASKWRGEG